MGWVWGGVRWDGVSSRIKEGKHEVININLFVSNTRNSGPATIINYFLLSTPELLLVRGGPPLGFMDSAFFWSRGVKFGPPRKIINFYYLGVIMAAPGLSRGDIHGYLPSYRISAVEFEIK